MYWCMFFRVLFFLLFQQTISFITNEPLIPYSLIKRAPETQKQTKPNQIVIIIKKQLNV